MFIWTVRLTEVELRFRVCPGLSLGLQSSPWPIVKQPWPSILINVPLFMVASDQRAVSPCRILIVVGPTSQLSEEICADCSPPLLRGAVMPSGKGARKSAAFNSTRMRG